jgi:hypothetical protein
VWKQGVKKKAICKHFKELAEPEIYQCKFNLMFVLFNLKILYSFQLPNHVLARNFAMESHNLVTHIYKLKTKNNITQKLNNERTNTMKSYHAPLTAQEMNESNAKNKIPSPFCFFFICEFIIRSDPAL